MHGINVYTDFYHHDHIMILLYIFISKYIFLHRDIPNVHSEMASCGQGSTRVHIQVQIQQYFHPMQYFVLIHFREWGYRLHVYAIVACS